MKKEAGEERRMRQEEEIKDEWMENINYACQNGDPWLCKALALYSTNSRVRGPEATTASCNFLA